MDTPETINIEKYIDALNNLLGSDNAYYAGDPDVDAIVELIKIAKKLEDRVKELTKENERMNAEIEDREMSHINLYNEMRERIEQAKSDTVCKIQEKLKRNIAGLVHYVLPESDLDQIVKEMLED